MSEAKRLENIDKRHLWHPFTQWKVWSELAPLIVDRGEGVELIDVEGRRYLDGVSSLWCNVHGHSEPALLGALKAQADKVCHSTLLGLTHRPILELAEELAPLLPEGLTRMFFCDSGSNAVEAALRMTLEWWQKKGGTAARRKSAFASLDCAYHGDTLGSVGVGFLADFHHSLESVVVQARRVSPPHVYRFYQGMSDDDALARALLELEEFFEREGDTLASFIVEPLVQGAAGMWIHPAIYLRKLRELCSRHDVFLICDEVATGFGKTGELFACQHAGVLPDLLVMGKGLTGGLLALSAVCVREDVFAGFSAPVEEGKTFFYGQTYAGNPLAAAVAVANLRLLQQRDTLGHVRNVAQWLKEKIEEHLSELPWVDEVRQLGVMTGVELTAEPGSRKAFSAQQLVGVRITQRARELGVIIRPLGNVMVLMPPLCITRDDVSRLVRVTAQSIADVLGQGPGHV
ncbi:MAG: adenosylmethionine--8-amino-7-oxononanoate transaminase [bacterium]|nr:adenosylmethionine--8-amino-7-oxononanoate transaminase [bacterium]